MAAMKLIFGCGYLGWRVARLWRAQGDYVQAVTRSAAKAEQLRAAKIEPLQADITQPETLSGLPPAQTVLVAVGFDHRSGQTLDQVHAGGLATILAQLPPQVGRVVYISTTGVHAATTDDWIDETAPCDPVTPGGAAHLAAERLLANHPLGQRAVVLRLAGLYGPDRIPRRDDLLAGRPIPTPRQGWLNLIHVDDAAAAVLAAERLAAAPRTYLVSDGHPVQRGDYLEELARLLGAPAPCFSPEVESPPSRRGAASRRIANRRLVRELEFTLRYPSYREGLAAIVAGQAE
jgi:nucleoside-diphosphate-sugar epimerase